MKEKTFIMLVEILVGVQLLCTALLLTMFDKPAGNILSIFYVLAGVVIICGLFSWCLNIKFGKGKWENKEV